MSIAELTKEIRLRSAMAISAIPANDIESKTLAVAEIATLAVAASSKIITTQKLTPLKMTDCKNAVEYGSGNIRSNQEEQLCDTRRYCSQCENLARSGLCQAAKRGELPSVSSTYGPVTDVLRHCVSYVPRNAASGIWVEINNPSNLFDSFFNKAEQAGLNLLADDKRWLQSLGFARVKELLDEYIQYWVDAMGGEMIDYKKQNVGRFSANTFIREALQYDR